MSRFLRLALRVSVDTPLRTAVMRSLLTPWVFFLTLDQMASGTFLVREFIEAFYMVFII